MNCKYCGSENTTKKGMRHHKQTYKCKDCGHIFVPNGKFSRMRNDKNIIVAALNFYYVFKHVNFDPPHMLYQEETPEIYA